MFGEESSPNTEKPSLLLFTTTDQPFPFPNRKGSGKMGTCNVNLKSFAEKSEKLPVYLEHKFNVKNFCQVAALLINMS